MKKYCIFRELLDFMSDHAMVVDADMNNYSGDIEIIGETEGQTITIKVSITEEENNGD